MLIKAQVLWTGHQNHTQDDRPPKQWLHGELQRRSRKAGGQIKYFNGSLKALLIQLNIKMGSREALVQDTAH